MHIIRVVIVAFIVTDAPRTCKKVIAIRGGQCSTGIEDKIISTERSRFIIAGIFKSRNFPRSVFNGVFNGSN